MSDKGSSEAIPTERGATLAQVTKLIAEMETFRTRAEGAASSAEQANAKANSESAFAFNAKQVCEEHAKAISQIKGTVEADSTWLATTKKNADDLSQAITTAKGSADSSIQEIAKLRETAERAAAAAKAAKEASEAAQASAIKSQNEIDAFQAGAGEDAALITQSKAEAVNGANTIANLQIQVTEAAAKVTSQSDSVAKCEVESKASLKAINDTAVSATEAQERVNNYEDRLTHLKNDFELLHQKIESLLPGATSAGLASAFREQKARFDKSQRQWLKTFVLAIFGLLAAALVGLPTGPDAEKSWDPILRHLVNRLPFVVPLVWLGIFAGRNYMLALRVQEEYAYKEALSATFEGYKREMLAITSPGGPLPILTLCENVLRTLSQRPGRIYEGKQEDITPLSPVRETVAPIVSKAVDGIFSKRPKDGADAAAPPE
jgi:hypothetical protein